MRYCSSVMFFWVHCWRQQHVWHSFWQVRIAAEVLQCLVLSLKITAAIAGRPLTCLTLMAPAPLMLRS